jgi:preprotein translocase subunit YajC
MDLSNLLNSSWCETVLNALLMAQQDAAPAAGAGGGSGGLAETVFGNYGMLIPTFAIIVGFYLLILLPERKRRAEQEKLLGGIKKNDRIVTTGGIIGVVVMAETGSKQVTIRIDEKTDAKMTLLRSAIAQVLIDDAESDGKKAS